ncbi:hypothetical protein [Photobacterium aquimaris]|uniref:hypothetical protein n=1 Tax=Photobacterium aquimaris TaxID=512643 RepID=UPI0007F8AC1D|nr:hypothetical protein [Photobacterium aquimaris]OBU24874.1 hypothetical protein AYY21_10240 [Photobacterium aquimaris]
MKYLLFNAPFILGVVFLLSLISTYLGWSDLFNEVSSKTVGIYVYVSIILICIGLILIIPIKKNFSSKLITLSNSFRASNKDKYIFSCLFVFFIIEVIYSGNIPIFSSSYADAVHASFGIPLLHGLYLAFLSYISIVYFQIFLYGKKKSYVIYIIIINIIFILLARRGIIVFHFISYTFIYFLFYVRYKNIKFSFIIKMLCIVSIFFTSFNYIGNMRLGLDK